MSWGNKYKKGFSSLVLVGYNTNYFILCSTRAYRRNASDDGDRSDIDRWVHPHKGMCEKVMLGILNHLRKCSTAFLALCTFCAL